MSSENKDFTLTANVARMRLDIQMNRVDMILEHDSRHETFIAHGARVRSVVEMNVVLMSLERASVGEVTAAEFTFDRFQA